MALFTFQSTAAETYNGTADSDLFVASNNFFGAGDKAFGMGGIDDFQYYADASLTGGSFGLNVFGQFDTIHTFAAFTLNSVETFTTVNDSGDTIVFDLSSSSGITDLVVSNGSAPTVYDQVTQLANVRLVNLTNVTTADFAVGFQAAVTAGATALNLVFDNTSGDVVRIGTSTGTMGAPSNAGIETIHLTVLNGDSAINTLDVGTLTTLIIDDADGAFSATINGPLSSTITTVTNNSDGDATINASAAAQSVTFTGMGGAENFTGGAFADTFNLGDGDNTVATGGGANTVTTGNGADLVFAQGTTDTVTTGLGADTIVDTTSVKLVLTAGDGSDSYIGIGGNFNASTGNDSLNMGADFDVIFTDAGTTDAAYKQVTGAEGVALYTAGTTTLGTNAQAAGINTIFLGSGSAGNDTVDASSFTTGLTVQSSGSDSVLPLTTVAGRIARFGGIDSTGGGDDTITTGSAVDYYLFRGDGALTDSDALVAGGQTNAGGAVVGDTLVLEGDTTLAGGASFSGFEFVALESAVGSAYRAQTLGNSFGNQYNLTLTDANAPSVGRLYINGSNLKGAVAGNNANEFVVVDASAVTAYGLDITTGGGTDFITLGAMSSAVNTQGGNDFVIDGAGDDVIDVGLGNNAVNLIGGGNNTVFAGNLSATVSGANASNNSITVAAAGNQTIFTGAGNDYIYFTVAATGADTLVDGGGFDTVEINYAGFADSQLAGFNAGGLADGYERLQLTANQNYTLGANAARAGFFIFETGPAMNGTVNLNTGSFDKAVLVDLQMGGNHVVNLGNVPAIAAPSLGSATPAGFFDFVGPPVGWPSTTVPAAAGAADRTGNANLVLAGSGTETVNGGTGSDVVRVNGTEWDAADAFAGGAGYDAMQIDNTAGGVTAVVNLANVTGVELFQTLTSGDRLPGVDADTNTITFTGGSIGTLTNMKLDNSAMNDTADTTRYVLDAGLTDADFAFTIFGAAAGVTILDKQNLGVNNNINFQGGNGQDIILITGADLGSTTIFNGGGGTTDTIVQTGGVLTDDSFTSVDNVEILTATTGNLNATLGAQAATSGLTTITGTSGNDNVLLDAAFTSNLAIALGGGNDTINAQNAAGTMTFSETLTNITAADTIIGGANGADVFNINAAGGGSADLTNVSGIEIYNVTANGGDAVDLVLGAGAANGGQTFNLIGNGGATNIGLTFHGALATVNTTVNALGGNDAITTGAGNDVVNGGAGNDSIYGNGGADTLNGGAGNDEISGGNGNDVITGGDGADKLRGQAGNDNIDGGAGNDIIYGGAGADVLSGGAGADVYLYDGTTTGDSPFGGRDTVTVGTGDTFDFGIAVTFVGSQANFADAQSAISAGGAVEAVFQADANILWLDVNNDGTLNNNDLQIQIQFADGLTTMTSGMFPASATTVAAFDASFAPAV